MEVVVPACLNVHTSMLKLVKDGNSIASIAKRTTGRELDRSLCADLKQLNSFDVCQISQIGRLRAGTFIRVPNSEEKQLSSPAVAVLTASTSADAINKRSEEFPKALLIAYNAPGATLQSQTIQPFTADATPTSIVPTETCKVSKPPFDAGRLVDAITRFRSTATNKKIEFQSKVLVGIVDTGLLDLPRTKVFEQFPPSALLPDKEYTNLIESNLEGTLARAFPGGLTNISPEAGTYADHGTHVAGLVIGGPDFWEYLLNTKFVDKATPWYFASYIPKIVPIKVMSSLAAGLPPQTGTGQIISALTYLRSTVSIVNLSYTAKYDLGLANILETIQTNNQVLIIAAAGNDYLATHVSLDNVKKE